MRNIVALIGVTAGMLLVSGPAFAGNPIAVPEPVSLSRLAGGVVALAAGRHLRRK